MRAVAAITQDEGGEDGVDYHQPDSKSSSGSKPSREQEETDSA
jgi:hypothetical protein